MKQFFALLLALCLLLPAIPAKAQDSSALVKLDVSGPFAAQNKAQHEYGPFSSTVCSYLYENEKGGFTRVEYAADGFQSPDGASSPLIVEEYDSNLSWLGSWELPMGLPIWGGFYSGEQYNYIITGQENPEEDNSLTVIQVDIYRKDWSLEDTCQASCLHGVVLTSPFSSGSLRCTEHKGVLYINTSRLRYTSMDGLRHQSNLLLRVEPQGAAGGIAASEAGPVSRSLNQFILVDSSGGLLTLDQGDGYPRALLLQRFALGERENFATLQEQGKIVSFPGEASDSTTGCAVGGFAETENGYVCAYTDNGLGTDARPRQLYLGFASKDGLLSSSVQLPCPEDAGTPVLVPLGPEGGYILWNQYRADSQEPFRLYYAQYDANGQLTGPVHRAEAPLSDCQPIVQEGKLLWYAGQEDEPLSFYQLDGTEVVRRIPSADKPPVSPEPPARFPDVNGTEWFAQAVSFVAEAGIMVGTDKGFEPSGKVTRGQLVTILYSLEGRPSTDTASPFPDASKGYYAKAVAWAAENLLVGGYPDGSFRPGAAVSRQDLTLILYQYAKLKGYDISKTAGLGSYSDAGMVSPYAKGAMEWAVGSGMLSGSGGALLPKGTASRAQMAVIMENFCRNIAAK